MSDAELPRSQDKVAMLKRVPVFAACDAEQLHLVADRTRLVEYKRGEHVYREGDVADSFYILSTGRLRVFAQVDGVERTLAILHNGDAFGEISLLTGEAHSATIQALNDTLVLQLQKRDFEELINRIPSLVLYLSRLLSKRLRAREHGGGYGGSTIVAIIAATHGVGRTCLTGALAALLKRETGEGVVVVDAGGDHGGFYGPPPPALLPERAAAMGTEERLETMLREHRAGFSVLFEAPRLEDAAGEGRVAPLLSLLTNRFHYVLVDLPIEITPSVLKVLSQSDLIYVVTEPQRERIIHTNALLNQIRASLGPLEHRLKVVLNLMDQSPSSLDRREAADLLGLAAAYALPYVAPGGVELTPETLAHLLEDHTAPYTMTVRRIARELGGLLVGLALGSGAALGLAHIGVLKVIEREKIPIDLIAGSSIGALVAGLWASGKSAEELEQLALRFKNPWHMRQLFILDFGIPAFSLLVGAVLGLLVGSLAGFWTGLLFGFLVCIAVGVVVGPLAGGPIQGARLMEKLEQDFEGKTFDQTWLPLKIVASNPVAREEIVFESGGLAEAVRASVSIPGIFKPVQWKGKICLDGGVANPIPVSVLKRAGAKHVIAVNVFPTTEELTAYQEETLRRRAERDATLTSRSLPVRVWYRIRQELVRSVSPLIFDVIMRSMQAMEHQIAEVACREADCILRPTLPGSHWLEFYHPEKFIKRGEEVALQYLPELRRITKAKGAGPPAPSTAPSSPLDFERPPL